MAYHKLDLASPPTHRRNVQLRVAHRPFGCGYGVESGVGDQQMGGWLP